MAIIQFVIDSGDYKVGFMRWDFEFIPQSSPDPTESLRLALREWAQEEGLVGDDISVSQSLDECPDLILGKHGLHRLRYPSTDEVRIDFDPLLESFIEEDE